MKILIKTALSIICVLTLLSPLCAQQPKASDNIDQDKAVSSLKTYLELRLNDANWKEYSKYITWLDEPAWDCKWLISNYSIGQPNKKANKIIVPVAFTRLGLYCYDTEFEQEKKEVIIKYELENYSNEWKVTGPDIDYPEIGANTVIRSLKTLYSKTSESTERRDQANMTARKIEDALKRAKTSH